MFLNSPMATSKGQRINLRRILLRLLRLLDRYSLGICLRWERCLLLRDNSLLGVRGTHIRAVRLATLWLNLLYCLLLRLPCRHSLHLPCVNLVVPSTLVLIGVDFYRHRKRLAELDVHLLYLLGTENIEADFLRIHFLCLQDIVLAHPCVARALRYALFWRQYRDYLSCYFHLLSDVLRFAYYLFYHLVGEDNPFLDSLARFLVT